MIDLKNHLSSRRREVECLLKMLTSGKLSVMQATIIKSSLILLLYNFIESTMSRSLERLHKELEEVSYVRLQKELQQMFIKFYLHGKEINHLHTTTQEILDGKLRFPSWRVYDQSKKALSGNVDARKIQSILGKYKMGGCRISEEDKKRLLIIKNIRNKLAHGEVGFHEAMRERVVSDLESFACATYSAVDDIIKQLKEYIELKKYLQAF